MGVALFSALSYAFTSSNRSSTTLVTDEQASVAANEIIAYGNEVKQTVKRLQLRGCDDTEISFENNQFGGYINPNAPPSKKCHVFDIAGGGLVYRANLSNNAASPLTITGAVSVQGVETSAPELYFQLNEINMSVCHKINRSLGIIVTPEDDIVDDIAPPAQFIGTYGSAGNIAGDQITEFSGQKSFCRKDSSNDYFYLITLIPR